MLWFGVVCRCVEVWCDVVELSCVWVGGLWVGGLWVGGLGVWCSCVVVWFHGMVGKLIWMAHWEVVGADCRWIKARDTQHPPKPKQAFQLLSRQLCCCCCHSLCCCCFCRCWCCCCCQLLVSSSSPSSTFPSLHLLSSSACNLNIT